MIKAIMDAGLGNWLYYSFHVLGFLAVFLFNVWYGKKRGISPKKAIITTLIVYPITYIWIYIQCWAENGFTNFGGNNIVRGFVYIPLFAWPVAKLFKYSWRQICDFIAPCVPLCQAVSHIGCIFVGCCYGYACGFGIYHPRFDGPAFPVQLFEAATAFAIFWWLVHRSRRNDFRVDGLSYPIMLMLFGSTRFLWEFARDNQKLIWGLSTLALHAAFMAVVGCVLYIHLRRQQRKADLKSNHGRKKG